MLGVIPARIGSERLPRKPLHPLAGRPLLEWVWRRACTFGVLDAVVVATDSEEVAQLCRHIGAAVELTAPTHGSGTERVAEVATRQRYRAYDIVVNVQGDEPFIGEEAVAAAVRLTGEGWDVGTVATPVRTLEAWRDPAVVKVVVRRDGGALYFSRAPIPWPREGEPTPAELASGSYLRHVGVYACTRRALTRWVGLAPAELERIERLEQLRAMAAGLTLGIARVEHVEEGVDTPEDAQRADERLRELGEPITTVGLGE